MSLKFNDNGKIEKSDRYYKVTPLYINQLFKYDIFSEYL